MTDIKNDLFSSLWKRAWDYEYPKYVLHQDLRTQHFQGSVNLRVSCQEFVTGNRWKPLIYAERAIQQSHASNTMNEKFKWHTPHWYDEFFAMNHFSLRSVQLVVCTLSIPYVFLNRSTQTSEMHFLSCVRLGSVDVNKTQSISVVAIRKILHSQSSMFSFSICSSVTPTRELHD